MLLTLNSYIVKSCCHSVFSVNSRNNPKSFAGGLMIFMIFTMSFSGILFSEKINKIEDQLIEQETKLFATSPGHSVFGEYVGAEWCSASRLGLSHRPARLNAWSRHVPRCLRPRQFAPGEVGLRRGSARFDVCFESALPV